MPFAGLYSVYNLNSLLVFSSYKGIMKNSHNIKKEPVMNPSSNNPIPDRSQSPYGKLIPSLQSVTRLPGALTKEVRKAVDYARRFNDEVARPIILAHDRETFRDPGYMPMELMQKANEWGFYTMFIPKIYGGKGVSTFAFPYVAEELASVCVGMANVMFVHYLGVSGLIFSLNLSLVSRIMDEIIEGEKNGTPCIVSLAITEPGAGTDVEDRVLVDRAHLACFARRVDGGYIVSGSKVFISMGHVSTWCCLMTYEHGRKPSDGSVSFAVKTGTKGFSFGRHEDKMGQRVCPASELLFDECFIPDKLVLTDDSYFKGIPKADIIEQGMHLLLGMSRAAVGAFGTGIARGAYEDAVAFASSATVGGKLLINHEWAQYLLAQMYTNYRLGRLSYIEQGYADFTTGGITAILLNKIVYYYMKFMPRLLVRSFSVMFLNSKWMQRVVAKFMAKNINMEGAYLASGYGSMAKIVGTDMGVKNCHLALELMGQAGIRHDRGIEKRLRDSKLLQIYEGTNQLNHINLFNCHIGNSIPGVKIFED
jgi:acyl-CoA dehydrogenase